MQSRIPFIAAVLAGVITAVATALYLQDYMALVTAVLIVSYLVLRLNAWALVGGFLVGLHFEVARSGTTEQQRVVIVALVAGALLQLAAAFIAPIVRHSDRERAVSVGGNAVFAMIGATLVYAMILASCPDREAFATAYLDWGSAFAGIENIYGSGLSRLPVAVVACQAMRTTLIWQGFSFQNSGFSLELLNRIVMTLSVLILVTPLAGASVFAGVHQAGLQPRRLPCTIGFAYLAGSLAGIVGLAIWIVLLFASAFDVWHNPQSNPLAEKMGIILLTLILFLHAMGAGFGAAKCPRR